jgi:hypothetical protein
MSQLLINDYLNQLEIIKKKSAVTSAKPLSAKHLMIFSNPGISCRG